MEKYDQITSPDDKGKAEFIRRSDNKSARVKITWFKASPDGDGMVAVGRVNAIRLSGLHWA